MALTRLKNLKAREVSLVDRAAIKRRFLILKEDSAMSDILKSVLETDLENESKVDEILKAAGIGEEAVAAVKGSMRLLTAYKDELPDDILATIGNLSGFEVAKAAEPETEEVKKAKEAEEEKVFLEKLNKAMTEKCAKCDKVKKCEGPKVATIRKADGSYDLTAEADRAVESEQGATRVYFFSDTGR
jgi:phage tail tape-measure protein